MSNKYWQERLANIKDNVTIRQVIDYFHIPSVSEDLITQLRCPFHGNDMHASARIYETNTMYCWVCTKSWDVISFIRDYKKISFAESCAFLENTFNLKNIDRSIAYQSESLSFLDPEPKKKEIDFERDFDKVKARLLTNKDYFELEKYVRYFYFFDTLYYNWKSGQYLSDTDLKISLDLLYKEIQGGHNNENSSVGSRRSFFA